MSDFVNIATVDLMHVETEFAAVNKKDVVIEEGSAVAAVQKGCN